jgi:hypothetical protein
MSGGTGAFFIFPSNPLFIGLSLILLYLFLYALALRMAVDTIGVHLTLW